MQDGIFYPAYLSNSLSHIGGHYLPVTTNSSGDTFYNGVDIQGPDAFWQPTITTNSVLAAMGFSNLDDAANALIDPGQWTLGDGGISGDQLAQENGYASLADMAVQENWGDGPVGEESLLLDYFGNVLGEWFSPPSNAADILIADAGSQGLLPYLILTGILGCTWVQRNYRGELAETEGVRDIEGCLQGRNAAPIPTARITKTHRKVFI